GRIGGGLVVGHPEVPPLRSGPPGGVRLPAGGRAPVRVLDRPVRRRIEAVSHRVAPSGRCGWTGSPSDPDTLSPRIVEHRGASRRQPARSDSARRRRPRPRDQLSQTTHPGVRMTDAITEPRSALITGGNRGIGRSIAEESLRRGDRVAVTSRSGQGGPEGALTVAADVTDGDSLDAAIKAVEEA